MSLHVDCDWCDQAIDVGAGEHVIVEVLDADLGPRSNDRHFHDGCWGKVCEVVEFSRRATRDLDGLPVCADPTVRKQGLEELVSPAPYLALRGVGIRALGDVADRPREEIADIRGVGRATMRHLEEALAQHGLGFRAGAEVRGG